MKHFVENKTGNVLGYDGVEQSDLISGLDMSLYTAITNLPTQFETWDVATKAFVNDSIAEALHVATQYQRDRAAEYPPQADYLDAIVKGDTVAQQAYIDACLAVKAKYPKPL